MSDMMIFSTDSLIRSKYAAYPIFSLRKSDTEMIQEYRDRCLKLDIPFSEIDLPGATEPEVGFVTSWKNTEKFRDSFPDHSTDHAGVGRLFMAWLATPILTLLPEGVTLPVECYQPLLESLQEYVERGIEGDPGGTIILLNVPTGEKVRVMLDFVKKTYHIYGDVTGWLHVAELPDL